MESQLNQSCNWHGNSHATNNNQKATLAVYMGGMTYPFPKCLYLKDAGKCLRPGWMGF